MKISGSTRLILVVLGGVALPLSFPNYNLFLLAWIAVALLILACLGARKRDAVLYGFINGALFYPIGLPWIATVMHQYGSNIGWLSADGILALMTLAGCVFPIVFAVLVAVTAKRSVGLACALAPFLWVALEFVRAHLPIIGFPWNLIGYAASRSLALVQITSVTGIYGLSLLIVAFNAVLAWAIASRRSDARRICAGSAIALVIIAIVCPRFVPQAKTDHVAHLIQTNFPQQEIYPSNWMELHTADMMQLEAISIKAARQRPGVIIWPEVPAPFSLQDPKFTAIAQNIAQKSGAYFLVGVVDWTRAQDGQWLAANAAVLLNPQGQREFTYDKIHLVPFGEYVPLRKYLVFARSLTAGIGDFTPGREFSVGELPGGKFSVYICYEAIFPNEVRQFVRRGAQLLINISNDGWFGNSSAPAQHLMMARVRAVENRRWLLRATNNGLTVDVDPYGRTVAAMKRNIRGQLDAPYAFRSDLSVYTRWGDWIAWLSVLASVILILISLFRRAAFKIERNT